jgi:hypothetical protein
MNSIPASALLAALEPRPLVDHAPTSHVFWRVAGRSHRHIVVAQADGDFTVNYLRKRAGRIKLAAGNSILAERRQRLRSTAGN